MSLKLWIGLTLIFNLLSFTSVTYATSPEVPTIIPSELDAPIKPIWVFHGKMPYITNPLVEGGMIFIGDDLEQSFLGTRSLYALDVYTGIKTFSVEESGPISFEPKGISGDTLLVGLRSEFEGDIVFTTYSIKESKRLGTESEPFNDDGWLSKDRKSIIVLQSTNRASFQVLDLLTKQTKSSVQLGDRLISEETSGQNEYVWLPGKLVEFSVTNGQIFTKLSFGEKKDLDLDRFSPSLRIKQSMAFFVRPPDLEIWDLKTKKLFKSIQLNRRSDDTILQNRKFNLELDDDIIYVATDNSRLLRTEPQRSFSDSGMVFAINWKTGQLLWRTQIDGDVTEPPILGKKFLFIRQNDSVVKVLDRISGVIKWVFVVSDSPNISYRNYAVKGDMLFICRGKDVFAYDLK